ncbi:arabinofuranosidase catalytic domain-containing protein [Microbacterium sp. WCS2018Hpa-9]|uniref:arabinofuranosidase catalytic domain-containing protein n=1 Tax=Microbacterium sp. WCS2018Hpa-9 TaxID=3073635 RepID=UPI00288B6193|nr:arabinofuranosidase catalytic domain-containing protein [Microbacterium sp. WCS2018Hpa-9]
MAGPYDIPAAGTPGSPGFLTAWTTIRAAVLDMDARLVALETGTSPFTGAFDSFAAPYRVHSLRRLLGSYTGPAIRVRRSSDNTEQDISFTSVGALDTTALTTFAGAGSAYVATWYDQGAGARHFTQATTAAQPRIVNAGVVDVVNSKPAVVFDGTDDYLLSPTAGLFAATTATVAAVLKSNSNAVTNATVFSESSSASNNGFWRAIRGSSANLHVAATNDAGTALWGAAATGSNVFDLSQHQVFYAEASAAINTWKDNTTAHAALTATRSGATSPVRTGLGAHAGSSVSNFYNGTVQEIVAWATNETASRASIQTAQKDYWGTP